MATIMDKLNNCDAFAAALKEAETEYRKNIPNCGIKDLYAGYDLEDAKTDYQFGLYENTSILEWSQGICACVADEAENDWESKHGCYEFDCGDCMLCCLRNITICRFIRDSFEDGLELLGALETLHRMEDGSCDFTMADVIAGKRDND